MDRIRKNILIIYLGIIVFGILYAVISPIIFGGVGQPCPIYVFTGYYCPGCGATRMCVSVLRGDFSAAFRYNPFLFVSFIFWSVVSVIAFAGRPSAFRKKGFLLVSFFITVIIGILFGILRNFS